MSKTVVCWMSMLGIVCGMVCMGACGKMQKVDGSQKADLSELKERCERFEQADSTEKERMLDSICIVGRTDEKVGGSTEAHGLCCLSDWQIQLPECESSDNEFLSKAQDYYNLYQFFWNILADYEIWERSEFHGFGYCLVDSVKIINAIASMEIDGMPECKARSMAQSFRDNTVKGIQQLDFDEISQARDGYYVFLNDLFCQSDSASEATQDLISALCPDSLEICSLQQEMQGKGVADWIQKIMDAKDFDEQCKLTLCMASHSSTFSLWTLEVMQQLMSSGLYSERLVRVWHTWRCLAQMEFSGMSRDSIIPNYTFSRYLKQIYRTTVLHILDHPNDDHAVLLAKSMPSTCHMVRNGDCLSGNDALLWMMVILPDFHKEL